MESKAPYGNDATLCSRAHFDQLFKQYYAALVLFAERMLESIYDAEDVVADTYTTLWQRRPVFPAEIAARTYLYVSVRNACLNRLKHFQSQANRAEGLMLAGKLSHSAMSEVTRAETIRQAHDMIDVLPPECRKVMLLKYTHGLKNHEIAGELRISVNTVRNQASRGIYLIKKKLGVLRS